MEGLKNENPMENLKNYGNRFYEYTISNPGVFEAMLWYNKYKDAELEEATEGVYAFFSSRQID